ncbi:hypothetical protein GpSGHVEth015 [Glossina pallidipes salivary gland hypertrophy virus]|uniref:Uncharacterized protein n=1 Tax=Glossina hytrovirus (isolate Glossina pallidipes/Ethiopia/Seibersdorf/-) TaxID=379529 RepID=A0A0Y0G6S2_GHVS|nr:hypothetical protein GpSGHVEth015 [Glossina pallidipes salivary gland hypertrophy virus]
MTTYYFQVQRVIYLILTMYFGVGPYKLSYFKVISSYCLFNYTRGFTAFVILLKRK